VALKLITPATAQPVTLDDAKKQTRIDTSDDDARLRAYISSATAMAEQATGRALMPQEWELTLDAFPQAFILTRVPLIGVVSIKYLDQSGVLQTLDASQYTIDAADDYGHARVTPAYLSVWPLTRNTSNAVALHYSAGYGDASKVPESIKLWILAMVGTMYDNRASTDSKPSYDLGYVDRLLDPYKVW